MQPRFYLIAGFAILAIATGSCTQSRLELDYGTSANLSKFNQILDVDAGKNLTPVSGLDGEAAKANLDKYHKSFENPNPPPVYMLTFGGGK